MDNKMLLVRWGVTSLVTCLLQNNVIRLWGRNFVVKDDQRNP